MSNKYCSVRFKTGEELDKALEAALCSCDDAARAEAAAGRAEVALNEAEKMYVTNRTHWEEVISEGGNVFPSTSVSFKSSLGAISGLGKDQIVVGRKYVVTWNGTAYDCTAFLLYESSEDSMALGNRSLLGEGTDTGEPFCLSDFISSGCAVTKATATAEAITIQIDAVREVIIHHLDPKYIKDMHHETKEIVEILPETQATKLESAGEFSIGMPLNLTVGEHYIVGWNGVEYASTAVDGSIIGVPFPCLLNDGANLDTGAGFVFLIVGDDTGSIQATEDITELTISIRGEQTNIVPLPTKYLPDGVPYVEGEVVEILPETTFSLMHQDGIDSTFKDGLLGLVAGEKYKAVYNGVEYECAAEIFTVEGGTVIGFGNLTGLGAEHNTGEPFGVADIKSSYGNNWFVGDYTGSSVELENGSMSSVEVTVSIKQGETTVRKIDPRCLPEGVPYVEGGVVEILPDYTIASEDDMFGIPALGLVEGNTYIVTVNGVEYTCVAWEFTVDGITAIGLGDAYTFTDGGLGTAPTGEPFVLIELPPEAAAALGMNVMVQPLSDDLVMPVTFSIKGDGATIRKLDNRCLDLAWLPVVNETLLEEMNTAEGSLRTSDKVNQSTLPFGTELVVYVDGVRCEATVSGDGGPDDGYYFFCYNDAGVIMANISLTQAGYRVQTTEGDHTVSFYKPKPNKLPNEFLDLAWLPTVNRVQILPKQTVTVFIENGEANGYSSISGLVTEGLEKGTPVKAIINGITYDTTLTNDLDVTGFACAEIPCIFTVAPRTGFVAYKSGTYTIELYAEVGVNKLPAEFLPDDATELHLTSSSGKKFKITVSDDGTLSAVEATT